MWSEEGRLSSAFCDAQGRLKYHELQKWMEQVAGCDLAQGGETEKQSEERIWVLRSIDLDFLAPRPPKGRMLRLETRLVGRNRLYTWRDFCLTDKETGMPLCLARTQWLELRKQDRRPVLDPPEALAGDSYAPPFYGREPRPWKGQLCPPTAAEQTVRRRCWASEVDGNGHMNNSYYSAWGTDFLTLYWPQYLDRVRALHILYAQELLPGELVDISGRTFVNAAPGPELQALWDRQMEAGTEGPEIWVWGQKEDGSLAFKLSIELHV